MALRLGVALALYGKTVPKSLGSVIVTQRLPDLSGELRKSWVYRRALCHICLSAGVEEQHSKRQSLTFTKWMFPWELYVFQWKGEGICVYLWQVKVAVCTDLVEKKQLYVTHALCPAGSSEFLFFQSLPYVHSSNSLKEQEIHNSMCCILWRPQW